MNRLKFGASNQRPPRILGRRTVVGPACTLVALCCDAGTFMVAINRERGTVTDLFTNSGGASRRIPFTQAPGIVLDLALTIGLDTASPAAALI